MYITTNVIKYFVASQNITRFSLKIWKTEFCVTCVGNTDTQLKALLLLL